MPQILPCVRGEPSYTFDTLLGGHQVRFDFRWNERDAAWYFDVYDENEAPIIHGVKVVLGVPLGRRCTHPLFKNGVIVARERSRTKREPGLDDLGNRRDGARVNLIYFSSQEMAEELFRQASA